MDFVTPILELGDAYVYIATDRKHYELAYEGDKNNGRVDDWCSAFHADRAAGMMDEETRFKYVPRLITPYSLLHTLAVRPSIRPL